MASPALRVLVFCESARSWTARSLEHDIAAVGATAEAALDTLVKIIQAHAAFDVRHGRPPLSAFDVAPKLYWSSFAAAARFVSPIELNYMDGHPPIRIVAATTPHHPILLRATAQARIA